MWLLNTATFKLEVASNPSTACYAVLSHRWCDEELSFNDIRSKDVTTKPGYHKAHAAAQQASRDGFSHIWIDTCCINKDSSAELSEAIISMFGWYGNAQRCYVYLGDVAKAEGMASFSKADWFNRGWTLQELLAPRHVSFFDRDWHPLGTKEALANEISQVTGIDLEALTKLDLGQYSVAQKMSWAANRCTTRPEDQAYCLMGLFDIDIDPRYGEGEKAFIRLQEELIRSGDDHSIFAWRLGRNEHLSGLLAPSPSRFAHCQRVKSARWAEERHPFSTTNRGISITLNITPWVSDTYLAYLECSDYVDSRDVARDVQVGIFLRRLTEDDQYARIVVDDSSIWLRTDRAHSSEDRPVRSRTLYVRTRINANAEADNLRDRIYGYRIPMLLDAPCARFVVFNKHSDMDTVALLGVGDRGPVMLIDLSAEQKGLNYMLVGFDFDFHPVCFLYDSFSDLNGLTELALSYPSHVPFDTEYVDWNTITENRYVFRRIHHNGEWALKGHRLQGLDVMLCQSPSHDGSKVVLKRTKIAGAFIWEVHVDNLAGPFATSRDRESHKDWHDPVFF